MFVKFQTEIKSDHTPGVVPQGRHEQQGCPASAALAGTQELHHQEADDQHDELHQPEASDQVIVIFLPSQSPLDHQQALDILRIQKYQRRHFSL